MSTNQNPNAMSLETFFTQGNLLPDLKEGQHAAQIKAITLVPAKTEGATTTQAYVRLEINLADRMIVENKFDQQFKIFCSHTMKQLNIDSSITVPELMQKLLETPINIWVSYDNYFSKARNVWTRSRNINFLPPITAPVPESTPAAPIEDEAPAQLF